MKRRRYYCVHISNRAGSSRQGPTRFWSRRFDTAGEANQEGKRLMETEATLAFTVEVDGDRKRVLAGSTRPPSAARIIQHYLALLGDLEPPGDETPPVRES